jgi:hypothetical protein
MKLPDALRRDTGAQYAAALIGVVMVAMDKGKKLLAKVTTKIAPG